VTGEADDVAADVHARIQHDPWASTLGIEFLEVRRGRRMAGSSSHWPTRLSAPPVTRRGSRHVQAPSPGAQLMAEASALRQHRRTGFYNVVVNDGDGRLVATVHCVAYRRESGP
jgi:acyl-coenzyme A thioesterase PaaI-like protein